MHDEEEEKVDEEAEKEMQFASIRIVVHEIGHMFGLRHCTYYACIMNGLNSAEEGARNVNAFDLCPVCLRKLQNNIGFDEVKRYTTLISCIEEMNNEKFNGVKGWMQKRVKFITSK